MNTGSHCLYDVPAIAADKQRNGRSSERNAEVVVNYPYIDQCVVRFQTLHRAACILCGFGIPPFSSSLRDTKADAVTIERADFTGNARRVCPGSSIIRYVREEDR